MDILQPIAAIVLVMALLAATLLLLRRRGAASFRLPRVSSGQPRSLEVLERVSLSPQHSLHLVRAGDRRILVATAPNFCQLLDGAFPGEQR